MQAKAWEFPRSGTTQKTRLWQHIQEMILALVKLRVQDDFLFLYLVSLDNRSPARASVSLCTATFTCQHCICIYIYTVNTTYIYIHIHMHHTVRISRCCVCKALKDLDHQHSLYTWTLQYEMRAQILRRDHSRLLLYVPSVSRYGLQTVQSIWSTMATHKQLQNERRAPGSSVSVKTRPCTGKASLELRQSVGKYRWK